jgi:hypothetical protein
VWLSTDDELKRALSKEFLSLLEENMQQTFSTFALFGLIDEFSNSKGSFLSLQHQRMLKNLRSETSQMVQSELEQMGKLGMITVRLWCISAILEF